MKKIYISPQTKIKEQAELLADMVADQKGFDREDPRWEKAFNNFLADRYQNSSVPKIENPRSSVLPEDVFGFYPDLSKQGFLSRGSRNAKTNENILKGAVTALTNLYCETILELKTKEFLLKDEREISDFQFPEMEGDNDSHKKEILNSVLKNIYARYIVASTIMACLNMIFSITQDEMINSLRNSTQGLDFVALKKKETRQNFLKNIEVYLKKYLNKNSLFNSNKS